MDENTETVVSPSDLLKMLESEPSSQMIEVKRLTLKTTPSKRIVSQEYQRIPRCFTSLFLHSYRRIRQPDARVLYESKADVYRNLIMSQMIKASKEIEKLTTRWIELLASQHDGDFSLNENYSNPVTIEIHIRTPEERDYWQIVEQMDYLLIVMDNLWQSKDMSITDKQKVTTKVIAQVINIGEHSARLSSSLRRLRDSIFGYEDKQATEQASINGDKPANKKRSNETMKASEVAATTEADLLSLSEKAI